MKKALISPNEVRDNGVRVAQVEAQEFEVAAPLFWVDCPDGVTTEWVYNDGMFIEPVQPEPVQEETV